jgi:hypothetical protein
VKEAQAWLALAIAAAFSTGAYLGCARPSRSTARRSAS